MGKQVSQEIKTSDQHLGIVYSFFQKLFEPCFMSSTHQKSEMVVKSKET